MRVANYLLFNFLFPDEALKESKIKDATDAKRLNNQFIFICLIHMFQTGTIEKANFTISSFAIASMKGELNG